MKEEQYYVPKEKDFHLGFEFEVCLSSTSFMVVDLSSKTAFSMPRDPWTGSSGMMEDGNVDTDKLKFTPVWQKDIFSLQHGCLFNCAYSFTSVLADGRIRVKYLDREDIESWNWKYMGRSVELRFQKNIPFITDGGKSKFSRIVLQYNPEDCSMKIERFIGEPEGIIFQGSVKNKSEFEKIMEQLNIPAICG